jgi:hypothetical protein
MKVLVTGGAGYIGSVTSELLLNRGHEVVVFDSFERGHRDAVDPRARVIEGDLRDRDSIINAMRSVRPEAVLHFAAYALVGESMEQPLLYFRNNVEGGLHLSGGHAGGRCAQNHLLLHLRDLRAAGPHAHDGGPAAASGQPLRRIESCCSRRSCCGATTGMAPSRSSCATSTPRAPPSVSANTTSRKRT